MAGYTGEKVLEQVRGLVDRSRHVEIGRASCRERVCLQV
jgi:hypothetical protein